jgi:hypothetical protein
VIATSRTHAAPTPRAGLGGGLPRQPAARGPVEAATTVALAASRRPAPQIRARARLAAALGQERCAAPILGPAAALPS